MNTLKVGGVLKMINNKKGGSVGSTAHPSKSSMGNNTVLSVWDAIEAFRDTLQKNGLGRPEIKPDSGIKRFKIDGDKGSSKSGWYNFHTDGDIPAGAYGNWRTGLNETFYFKKDNKPLTDAERKDLAKVYAEAKKQREAEKQKQYAKARHLANAIWTKAKPANESHPYLVKKHCQGLAQYLLEDKKGNLLVPIYNKKRLVSIQFINKSGGKFFLKGSELKGSYYSFPSVGMSFETVYLCEGISTGWTIRSLMNAPVFCSLTAGNLKNVALQLRQLFKKAKIVICCDNDVRKGEDSEIPNTGLVAGNEAALAVNGLVSVPMMPDGSKCDFNDLYILAVESQKKQGGSHG